MPKEIDDATSPVSRSPSSLPTTTSSEAVHYWLALPCRAFTWRKKSWARSALAITASNLWKFWALLTLKSIRLKSFNKCDKLFFLLFLLGKTVFLSSPSAWGQEKLLETKITLIKIEIIDWNVYRDVLKGVVTNAFKFLRRIISWFTKLFTFQSKYIAKHSDLSFLTLLGLH